MGDLLVCDAKLWNLSVQENWPTGIATSRWDALGMDLSPSERLGWTLLPFDKVLLTIPGKQQISLDNAICHICYTLMKS